jgi:excisionase family DNA binding protein
VLCAAVSGFSAFVIAPLLERRLEELARQGVHPDLLVEARRTFEAVRVSADEWQAWRIAADGNAAVPSAAVPSPSGHDEISADEAGAVLGVKARRVRQLLDAGQLEGRRVGGRWLVSRASVDVLRETRRAS